MNYNQNPKNVKNHWSLLHMVLLDRSEVQMTPGHCHFLFKFHFKIKFCRMRLVWVRFRTVLLSGKAFSEGQFVLAPPRLWLIEQQSEAALAEFYCSGRVCCLQRCAFSGEEISLFCSCGVTQIGRAVYAPSGLQQWLANKDSVTFLLQN
jgi:hypothetical protein